MGKFIEDALQWLLDAIKDAFEWVFEQLVDAAVVLLSLIPVPDWLANAAGLFDAVPSGIWWMWQYFEIGYGIGVMVGALVLRFILRRIPIIG